jgi:hypothetical protein
LKLETEQDMYEKDRENQAIDAVRRELYTSTEKYGTFRTTHEAFGVLREEVDEFWDACKANNLVEMEAEAIQVAAMAIRLIIDARRTKGL